jgi:hypothetical protein
MTELATIIKTTMTFQENHDLLGGYVEILATLCANGKRYRLPMGKSTRPDDTEAVKAERIEGMKQLARANIERFIKGEPFMHDGTPADPVTFGEVSIDSAVMPLDLAEQLQIIPARLTPADIEASIASEHYFTAADGVCGADHCDRKPPSSLDQLTFCVLVLRNGARVVGFNYGSIDPAIHDKAMGKSEARAMALEKVWELEGYLLRECLKRPSGTLANA